MPYRMHETGPAAANASHAVVDTGSQPYGVAVRDIFSDARWTPAEPVRARDWHDTDGGGAAPSSETTLD